MSTNNQTPTPKAVAVRNAIKAGARIARGVFPTFRQELQKARAADSRGGEKITKGERKTIARRVARAAGKEFSDLLIDILITAEL